MSRASVRLALPVLLVLVAVSPRTGPARGAEPELDRHFLSDSTRHGDWTTYEVTCTLDANDPAHATVTKLLLEYRVKEATRQTFDLVVESVPAHPDEWETHKVPRDSRSLRDLLWLDSSVLVSDVESREEARVVNGFKFRCQRLSFRTTEGALVQQNEVWLGLSSSHEFHGLRMVALATRPISGAARPVTLEMEIRGHGRANMTEWGATMKTLREVK